MRQKVASCPMSCPSRARQGNAESVTAVRDPRHGIPAVGREQEASEPAKHGRCVATVAGAVTGCRQTLCCCSAACGAEVESKLKDAEDTIKTLRGQLSGANLQLAKARRGDGDSVAGSQPGNDTA